jgi:two-component sensor histidine kinase/integral membrane sensor domain MASE1
MVRLRSGAEDTSLSHGVMGAPPIDKSPDTPLAPKVDKTAMLALAAGSGIAFFLAARLGLALLTEEEVAVFWPASGIAAGILIAVGNPARSPVGWAVMVASTAASFTWGRNAGSSIAIGLCDTAQVLLVAWLVERQFDSTFSIGNVRHVFGLLAAAAVATAITAVGATIALKVLSSSATPPVTIWQVWFTSDALGIITATPLVVGLFEAWHDPPDRRDLVKGALAVVVLAAASLVAFGLPAERWITIVPLAVLMPFMVWQAAHCRPVFVAATACVVAVSIVLTIKFGIGRLGDLSMPHSARVNAAQVAMLVIAGCSLILAALFAERHRYEAALREALAHQQALNAELDHRVKNVLATVCSIISQTQQGSTSHADFLARLDSRIMSLARTHELLSNNTWRGVELAKIVERELAPHSPNRCDVGGPRVTLKAEAAQALGMVLHELSTNAAKYGAFTKDIGRLSLRWWRQDGRLAIVWQERDGPPVVPPTHLGYGTSLIRELLPFELGGTVDLDFALEGINCRLEVPQLWVSWDDATIAGQAPAQAPKL